MKALAICLEDLDLPRQRRYTRCVALQTEQRIKNRE